MNLYDPAYKTRVEYRLWKNIGRVARACDLQRFLRRLKNNTVYSEIDRRQEILRLIKHRLLGTLGESEKFNK